VAARTPSFAQEYKDALTEWIASGGSYVGICMGGYLAGDEEGAFKLISVAREVSAHTDADVRPAAGDPLG
jgi:glutamine amidotransferase-like uncharacterized protein